MAFMGAGRGGVINTPGSGPNGPGPIDARIPIYDVGWPSTVPYGPTNGYATPNGVTGFVGPAAGSLKQPTIWYVRVGGSNNNGGTSTALGGDRSGSDGVTNATKTFTSASAAFTSADVGKGICINTGANARHHRIASVMNATTVVLDRISSSASSLAWVIGGAWADTRTPLASNFTNNDSNSPVLPGDTVYVGAGTYRIVCTIGSSWTQVFNGQVNIIGDVTGQLTGDAGMVQITAYTTNDTTAPSSSPLITANGASNIAFSNLVFVNGTGLIVTAIVTTSQNISFTDCAFMPGAVQNAGLISATNLYSIPFAWLFDRCVFGASALTALTFTLATGPTLGDYDANVVFQNCSFMATSYGNTLVSVTNAGTLTFNGGGIRFRNVFASGFATFIQTPASRISTVFPCRVANSVLGGAGPVLSAGTSGQIVEDYNLIVSNSPRTNVSAGAHSVSNGSYAPLFHFGQERIWLPPLFRPFGEPMANSPLLGFGNDGGQTAYDLRGPQNIRPAGGSSALPAVGALERADTFVADASPIGGGGSPIKLTGPGYNDFLLPISASQASHARTVSIKVKWDSSYGGTLPTLMLIAKPQQGLNSNLTITAVGSSGNVYTITLPTFTPTAGGVLTLKALSYDLSGASVVEWDDFTVA